MAQALNPAAAALAPALASTLASALASVLALALLAGCATRGLSPRAAPAKPKVAAIPTATPAPAPEYPQKRPVDQSLPVKVRSRSLRYDQASQETVFYGGVTATQDTTVLNAKELRSVNQGQSAHATGGVLVRDDSRRFTARSGEADYTDAMREAQLTQGVRLVSVDPYGQPVTLTGKSGRYSQLRQWAQVDGDVVVLRGALSATALGATLEEGGTRLLLEKDVRGTLGFNRLQSDMALFDQKDHSVDLEGDVRVRAIPSQLRAAADAPWNVSGSAKETP